MVRGRCSFLQGKGDRHGPGFPKRMADRPKTRREMVRPGTCAKGLRNLGYCRLLRLGDGQIGSGTVVPAIVTAIWSPGSGLHRLDHSRHTDEGDGAPEIVGQCRQAELCADLF